MTNPKDDILQRAASDAARNAVADIDSESGKREQPRPQASNIRFMGKLQTPGREIS